MSEEIPGFHRPTSVWVYGQTEDINAHYKLGQQLGQPGQFGKACIAEKLNPGPNEPSRYACKIISKARFSRNSKGAQDVLQNFRDEVEFMSQMDHPNIIKFKQCFEDRANFYIIMELCSGGELFDRITQLGHYSERDAARVLRQILEGLRHMHTKNIAHCDLKPDNFMFVNQNADSVLKIIDFGMAKLVRPRNYLRKFCGTPYYVAPEVLDGKFTEACDMWSVGVIIFVMLIGYPPFYADPAKHGQQKADQIIYDLIRQGFIPQVQPGYKNHFPQAIPISPAARDLISKLLVKDFKLRLTVQEALEHPWMTGAEAPDTPIALSVVNSLLSFNRTNKFKQSVLEIMTGTLSDDEINQLKRTFETMDEDKDGSITVAELQKAMTTIDKSIHFEEILRVMREADIDGNGVISYKELMLTFVQRKLSLKEERLWDAFQRLDVNKDGFITAAELKEQLGTDDLEMARAILAEADTDGNGSIDYEEFLDLWMKKLNPDIDSDV